MILSLWLSLAAASGETGAASHNAVQQSTGVEILKSNSDNISKYVRVAVGWHVMKQCNLLDPAARSDFERDVAASTKGMAAIFEKAYGDKMRGLKRVMGMQQQAKGFAVSKYSTCDSEADALVNEERQEASELAASLQS